MTLDPFWKKMLYRHGPVLDPVSRLSEVVFGLIMVLTFTGSIRISESGREEIGLMLWAALGCNVAWGIIDALMYLMAILLERGKAEQALKQIQSGNEPELSAELIKDYIPPVISTVLKPEEFSQITTRIQQLPRPPKRIPLVRRDYTGSLGVFLLVFLSTFPATLPFLIFKEIDVAMHVSNGVSLLLLFVTGFYLGRQSGYNPWLFGIIILIIGVLLVFMTIALGG
jgi:hypothetical protein